MGYKMVNIGNGLFAKTKVQTRKSLLDEYREMQRGCSHDKRDPSGMCYDCGHKEK